MGFTMGFSGGILYFKIVEIMDILYMNGIIGGDMTLYVYLQVINYIHIKPANMIFGTRKNQGKKENWLIKPSINFHGKFTQIDTGWLVV